jgi:NAD(P)H-dependent FMN reductase
MRVLLLNGALDADPAIDTAVEALQQTFAKRGAAVETRALRAVPVAWCQGCFECWTHTPGTCKIDDAGRDLSEAWVQSDVVVLVTPVTFGSYSSECKKMLDRTLGTLLPFFRRIDGEVHHWPRYESPPALGVFAVLDRPDPECERTVRTLAERNALNTAAPQFAVEVVTRLATLHAMAQAASALASVLSLPPEFASAPRVEDIERQLPQLPLSADGAPPKRALLLVGSAKPTGTSTSERLGMALMERLALRGIGGTVRHLHRDAHNERGLRELVASLRHHELLVLAVPLYFDAFPALVTRAMEAIVRDRRSNSNVPPLTVAVLINSGFPESRHSAVARTIGALFARAAQARWAGALQLGGGGVINGRALEDVGHVVDHLPHAIEETAKALASGSAIPQSARDSTARPLMPVPLYMAAGDAGWLWTAGHEGTLTRLWGRPVATTSD